MKIQASIKNISNKTKEINLKSKQAQKENWKKQEAKYLSHYANNLQQEHIVNQNFNKIAQSSLTLQSSVSAPRLHQNYDFVMIKGNRTLKGLTAKFKGLVEEQKPFYMMMQKNTDPHKFWGNQQNPYLISQGFEQPSIGQTPISKNIPEKKLVSVPQKVQSPQNKTSVKAKKRQGKYIKNNLNKRENKNDQIS